MKTKLNIVLITTALTLGLAGPLAAFPPGKDVSGSVGLHKHSAPARGTGTHAGHSMMHHRTGPEGK